MLHWNADGRGGRAQSPKASLITTDLSPQAAARFGEAFSWPWVSIQKSLQESQA